jgi:RNA polymerase sigma-70 factor (ECF subfamily)
MTAMADDHQLMARMAAKDQGALRTLLQRHQARVFRFIQRRVKNEAVAEELTNEVFMDAWRNAASFEGRSSASTWLLTIAGNRAISSLRKRREEAWDDDKAGELADGEDTPDIVAQKADKGAVMRRCLDGLTDEHREIIDLVYYQEMSVAEVAEIVGIPEATVKTRLFYARKKLAEILKANGIDRGWP